jgi:hypothetical protein
MKRVGIIAMMKFIKWQNEYNKRRSMMLPPQRGGPLYGTGGPLGQKQGGRHILSLSHQIENLFASSFTPFIASQIYFLFNAPES